MMDVKLRAFPRPAGGEGGKEKKEPIKKTWKDFYFFFWFCRRCVIYTSSSVPPSSSLAVEVYGSELQKYDRPHNGVFTSCNGAKTRFSCNRLWCVGKQGKSTVAFSFPLCWLESVCFRNETLCYVTKGASPTQTPFPGYQQQFKPGVGSVLGDQLHFVPLQRCGAWRL